MRTPERVLVATVLASLGACHRNIEARPDPTKAASTEVATPPETPVHAEMVLMCTTIELLNARMKETPEGWARWTALGEPEHITATTTFLAAELKSDAAKATLAALMKPGAVDRGDIMRNAATAQGVSRCELANAFDRVATTSARDLDMLVICRATAHDVRAGTVAAAMQSAEGKALLGKLATATPSDGAAMLEKAIEEAPPNLNDDSWLGVRAMEDFDCSLFEELTPLKR